MLTQPFADAVAEAEKIIRAAPHVRTEQDLVEGYDYLAGNIRGALQLAWAYERDFPFFVQSTGPYTKMGLDNPDTLYFHAYLRDDAEYIVSGHRGSTADLSFQVLNGDYSPVEVPDSLTAFDDREIEMREDGTFEFRFGPARDPPEPGYVAARARLRPCCWSARCTATGTQQRGTITIRRADLAGQAPPPPDRGPGQALRRGGQDPAVQAADVPRLSRVVLPEAAGQHDDRAAAARRAGWPPSSPRSATSTWPTTRR